ncbi:uncharacterized protein [Spinacia oleracea]|uniref:Uncharacterized protein n=1 Tax=Spinacia oleracea TaxID=3562 RepID=A0ABM3QHI8_SPIOL|nr:uncharacterized protein LOC110777819 [Spinacia oleracea]
MADGSLENLHTKGSLSVAYRTLMNMDKGSRKTKLTWKVVKCPRSQQVGLVESGYYVLKYMDQIVSLVLKKERDFQKVINVSNFLTLNLHLLNCLSVLASILIYLCIWFCLCSISLWRHILKKLSMMFVKDGVDFSLIIFYS